MISYSLKKLLTIVIMISLLLYLSYHIVSGKRGLVAMLKINQEIEAKTKLINELRKKRKNLEHKIELVMLYDEDFIDELARKHLGLIGPNEKVILLTANAKK